MAEIAQDDYTGNTDIGQATQTGFLDFWAMATAQAVYWPHPSATNKIHEEANALIQAGAVATAYVNNNSLAATLIGLKFEFTTPAVASFDVFSGSKIDVNLLHMKASTNRVRLSTAKIKMNEALEARVLQDQIKAQITQMEDAVNSMKTGVLGATVAEKIRL